MSLILSGTDGLSDVDGSAATPAIRGTDANTGIFFPAADTIAFAEGGAEVARFDSSGNFGLGVTPAVKLDVSGAASTNGDARFVAKVADTSAVAQGNGGGIMFRGVYTGTTLVDAAGVQAYKANATDNNYSYGLAFSTRADGGNLTANMRLNESGNLGLGVTPSAWSGFRALDVGSRSALVDLTSAQQTDIWSNAYFNGTNSIYKTTANASIYRQTTGQHIWFNAPSGTAGNNISFTQAMTLNASGNLGITETSPTAKLHISVASAVVDGTKGVKITNPGGTAVMFECGVSGDSFIGTTSGSDFNIRTGNTVRATFDTAGNLGLGSTSPINTAGYTGLTINNATNGGLISFATGNTQKGAVFNAGNNMYLDTNNVAGQLLIRNTATGATNTIQASGIITSPPTYSNTSGGSANMFVQTDGTFYRGGVSALKYKQDVRDLELIDINKFRAVRYKSKCEMDDPTEEYFGLIANEVDAAGIKELVTYSDDGEVEGFKYDRLTVVLLKAIQEQQALITQLTARITALESA